MGKLLDRWGFVFLVDCATTCCVAYHSQFLGDHCSNVRHPLCYTFLFGLLWGIGGLTYGLGVRYLGVSLGSSIILGLCMVFGSLIPSIYYQLFPQQGKDTIGMITGSKWGLTFWLVCWFVSLELFFVERQASLKENN